MSDGPSIFVIDDDEAVRSSIVGLLSVHGLRSMAYASAIDFFAHADIHGVGVVIADLAMPGITGEELQRRLAAAGSVLSVIIITGFADVKATVRVMQQGALTLLEKPFSQEDLLEAVRAGMHRSQILSEERSEWTAISQKLASLSSEDQIILQRMIAGCPIKACSQELHLSTRTVERRRRYILTLMGAGSIPELAVMVERARKPLGSCNAPKEN
jgi:FixJ family two-component response regulator